ncbi:hypothetical protein GCM10029963_15950 [Micromonospora andamanensis]
MQRGGTGSQLVGGEHRLVVLLLVLHDHAEGETVGDQPAAVEGDPVQQVVHLLPDGGQVGPGLGRRQQRQRRAVPTRLLERVVQVVDVAPDRLPPADVTDQPEFLLVAHVRQVPHQRGHQR